MIFLWTYLWGLPVSLLIYLGYFAYRVFPYMEKYGVEIKWGNFEEGLRLQHYHSPRGDETLDDDEWCMFLVFGTMFWPLIITFFLLKGLFKGTIRAMINVYHLTKGKP